MENNTRTHTVLLIGCGKMGGALLQQWSRSDTTHFTVCDPADVDCPANVRHVRSADALTGSTFDSLIIAVKPQVIADVLPQYIDLLSEDGFVASIVAGASAARLSGYFNNAPIIRIMPNLPSMIGRGVAGLYADDSVSAADRNMTENLMKLAGQTVWVDTEDKLDRVTAIAGSGPGYVFEFARAYVKAAEDLGFSNAEARTLVLATIAGTIDMAATSNDDLETLRNNVTSKNGTTAAGLDALNADDGLSQRLQDTVTAAYNRAIELR